MLRLRDYQIDAIDNLLNTVGRQLRSHEGEICIFQSPTGSGKTLMVAEFLRRLAKEQSGRQKFSFIWISVRRLHDQSKDKLDQYYENDRLLKCSYFEELENKQIGENEILFINWHSINKKDINIYVRDNEQENNLSYVVKNTKESGRQIILIIDESHHTANSDKSKELIHIISPKITIEVSATPHLKDNVSGIVKVNLDDVKDEEMIKTEVSINPEFKKKKVNNETSDELTIKAAILKRKTLEINFKKLKVNVNPLVLIQLPDRKKGLDDRRQEVEDLLSDKFDITEKNGKLAVWISEKHSDTLLNVEKNDSKVEVLIFKQAIALGWDCPRAQILVIFREYRSFEFTIQTIGRIMRMPELRHYPKDPELNKGFVFTNLSDIHIAEDYVKDYITTYESERRESWYSNISLRSICLKRQRERTRLSGKFIKIFLEIAHRQKLQEKINLKPSKIVVPVMSDGIIKDIDKVGEVKYRGTVDIDLSDIEVDRLFDIFAKESCMPFAPIDSSDRMKNALYQFFNKAFNIAKYDPKVQRLVLGKENIDLIIETISLAKEQYKIQVILPLNEKRDLEENDKWEVPDIMSFNKIAEKLKFQKSIMEPLYVQEASDPERKFMQLLDRSGKVKWWYKNSDGEVKYFAVLYKDEYGIDRAFYVDFIVKFKDGGVGLFDTKRGITASTAGPRAEGLQRYIKEEAKKGKKIWGGIVIHAGGAWRYNDEQKYHYDPNNLSNWKIFSSWVRR